ncbi:MAG TPA: class A beta-lactamase [Rhodanobacter sp.]
MKTVPLFAAACLGISLALICAAASARTTTPAPLSATRISGLQDHIDALVRRSRPGSLGVAVLDLHSGIEWRANAAQPFPMMSVFKAPVAAVVLAQVEQGELSMDQAVIVHRSELESGAIRDHFRGEQMSFTVRQLLTAAVSKSDNTAVDVLLTRVGGPEAVTAFLRTHGIDGMRVDLGERGFNPIFEDLPPNQPPPVGETAAQELTRLRRGYDAYLADPRNRSTPDAAVSFLRKLWEKKLLSPTSTQYLVDLMYAQTMPSRLRAGLPAGIRLADKCGTSYTLEDRTAAFNDIGILVWPDGHVVVVAAFLTASTASQDERQAIFVDLAREVAITLHP